MYISDAGQDFLYAILLQGAHAVIQCSSKHIRNACVFLNVLLDSVGAHHQFMQAYPAAIAGAGAIIASDWLIQRKLPLVIGELLGLFRI